MRARVEIPERIVRRILLTLIEEQEPEIRIPHGDTL
jgi:hypothetical protein